MHGYELDGSFENIGIEEDLENKVVDEAVGIDEVVNEAVIEPNAVDALLIALSTECGVICSHEKCRIESDVQVDAFCCVHGYSYAIPIHSCCPRGGYTRVFRRIFGRRA